MPALAENTNPERPAAPPTHAAYTPVGDGEGRKFSKWLKFGVAWRGPTGNSIVFLSMTPFDFDPGLTGYLRLVPVGQQPPAPPTLTRKEFVKDMLAAENDLGVGP